MKPNINSLAKFRELKKLLVEKNVSVDSISTIEKALKNGIVLKKAEDLGLLSISNVDGRLIAELVDFGGSDPTSDTLKRIEFTFVSVGDEKDFYGYQFLLTYTNLERFTIEESFPIDDTRKIYIDINPADILENSKISYAVKAPQGEYALISFLANSPREEILYVNRNELAKATIRVEVTSAAHVPNPPVRGSYQIKGKVISNESNAKTDGFQVVILASTGNLPDGNPEFLPVAYAKTETNGYFITGFLLFSDPDDVSRVLHAKAIVAKDEFQTEIPIKIIESTEGTASATIKKSTIPHRLILVINENKREGKGEDCGCNDLNFHKKKVFEEFSYYTVVRTTEPSVIADVIEEQEEIDLEDLYGTPGRGIKVPLGVFKKFYNIKSRQVRSLNPGLVSTSGDLRSAKNMSSSDSAPVNSPASILSQPDVELIRNLAVENKAAQIVKGKNERVIKGRTHLNPVNQINWDKATIYQAASIAHGHLLHFKQEWIPDGYSIGDLLYSLPLAPGQKKQIAVLDWERRESAANSQSMDYEENLNNSLVRDRDISEVINSTLDENIKANSAAKTKGIAGGLGGAAMGIIKGISFGSVLGISGGASKSSSIANQTSHRESTANSLQSIRDRTLQAASAVRSQRATVIQTVSQGERVQATSESVANYNHCHAMTIQYFEVIRHFVIQNRFVGAQECLFIPLQIGPFDIEKCLRWRNILERHLLMPGLRKAFEALERIQNEKENPYENYYDTIGFPRRNFAEQSITFLHGELYLDFYFFNTSDSVDDAIIRFFNIFRVDLKQFKDRKLTDEELSEVVGPRTIEYLLNALVVETQSGINMNLDLSLISPFRQNARLYVSLRQKGPIAIQRNLIDGVRIRLDEGRVDTEEVTDIKQLKDKYMKIKVRSGSLRYRTSNFAGTLFSGRIDNDLFVGDDAVFIPTPLNNDELRNPRGEDVDSANTLLHHLNENLEYYHKCLWFEMTAERRYMLLEGIIAPGKANGRSVASVVENNIIGVAGNSLIMPVAPGNQLDPTIDDTFDLFAQYYKEDDEPTRISLPTKGVYAEAVIGKCNSCEEKDESKFWRWEESPIPDSPSTDILPLNTDTRRADPGNLQPKDFPNPMVNIQNAPNLPDPVGLQNLLQILGKSDVFRDLSGLTENQKNALATFTSSLQAAQAFGKEASDLAKTAGFMGLLHEAQQKGLLVNADVRKLALSTMDPDQVEKREEKQKQQERKENKKDYEHDLEEAQSKAVFVDKAVSEGHLSQTEGNQLKSSEIKDKVKSGTKLAKSTSRGQTPLKYNLIISIVDQYKGPMIGMQMYATIYMADSNQSLELTNINGGSIFQGQVELPSTLAIGKISVLIHPQRNDWMDFKEARYRMYGEGNLKIPQMHTGLTYDMRALYGDGEETFRDFKKRLDEFVKSGGWEIGGGFERETNWIKGQFKIGGKIYSEEVRKEIEESGDDSEKKYSVRYPTGSFELIQNTDGL